MRKNETYDGFDDEDGIEVLKPWARGINQGESTSKLED